MTHWESSAMDNQVPRIVVVGGGASGLNLVTRLSRKLGRKGLADITLVDENLTHIWKPSLHEFAAGTKGPEEEISFLEHSNRNGYNFRLGRFAGIQTDTGEVLLDPVTDGNNVELAPQRSISFDYLVLAIGSRSNDFGTKGVSEHCLFLDTPSEAKRLQTELLNLCLRLETGALQSSTNKVGVAIVGGGATGVELAAELREATEQLGQSGIDKLRIPNSVDLTIIEASERLVKALPPNISERVLEQLTKLHISVNLNARVSSVEPRSILIGDNKKIDAEIIIWAAGIRSNAALSETTGLEIGSLGRIRVRPTLQSTCYDNIFVMGDAADCLWQDKGTALPPRAQVAAQQAKFMLAQIKRAIQNESLLDFAYVDRGSLVALSSNGAVGALMGKAIGTLTIEGWIARRAYKFLHYQHEAAIQGHMRALTNAVLSTAMRRIRPKLKLH